MSKTSMIVTGALSGATTKLARAVTRRAIHERHGAPRLPAAARYRQGLGVMLAWAAALGVLLAVADVMREQRKTTAPGA